ncbi:MAG: M48 family metallopeptidase, partial [Clostridia bacterium]|nr:M48 family metallopeptidase [Clostridia bacterium]
SSAKKRLGSCAPDGTVRFSYTLMLYPLDAVEYVVLHELAHLKERNHRRGFYALVERYMPDWRERRAMLKG